MMEIFWTMRSGTGSAFVNYIAEQNLMTAIGRLDEQLVIQPAALAGQPYKGRNGRVEGAGNWLFTRILFWFMGSTASGESVYPARVAYCTEVAIESCRI